MQHAAQRATGTPTRTATPSLSPLRRPHPPCRPPPPQLRRHPGALRHHRLLRHGEHDHESCNRTRPAAGHAPAAAPGPGPGAAAAPISASARRQARASATRRPAAVFNGPRAAKRRPFSCAPARPRRASARPRGPLVRALYTHSRACLHLKRPCPFRSSPQGISKTVGAKKPILIATVPAYLVLFRLGGAVSGLRLASKRDRARPRACAFVVMSRVCRPASRRRGAAGRRAAAAGRGARAWTPCSALALLGAHGGGTPLVPALSSDRCSPGP